jgi:hypothetical protein
MLRTALGPAITALLEKPAVVEVMLDQVGPSGSTGSRTPVKCWLRLMANGSFALLRIMSAPRFAQDTRFR